MARKYGLQILLAVDGSVHTIAAAKLIVGIRWPAGSHISILAILPERWLTLDRNFDEKKEVNAALEKIHQRDRLAAENLAAQVAEMLSSDQLPANPEVRDGRPSLAILQRASELPADLIVIGDRGLSAPEQFWLGSTAHKVAHYADCSVLVTRPLEHSEPMNVILAVDGSPEAQQAAELLCSLSLSQWGYVTVVGIAEITTEVPSGDSLPMADTSVSNSRKHSAQLTAGVPEVVQDALIEAAEARVAQVVRRLRNCGAQVSGIIRLGHPAEEILTIAQEQNAALIVLGARGRNTRRAIPFGWGDPESCEVCSVFGISGAHLKLTNGNYILGIAIRKL